MGSSPYLFVTFVFNQMEHVTSYLPKLHANRWRKRSTIILWHKLNHNMGMALMVLVLVLALHGIS
jgi:acyl-CoA synthetase (AMP-forming)/AMP-acid ligase II